MSVISLSYLSIANIALYNMCIIYKYYNQQFIVQPKTYL